MTIIPALLLAAVLYSMYNYLTFSPSLKDSNYVLPLGLICVLLANTIWIYLSKSTQDPSKLLQYGIYWDVLITGLTILLPVLVFSAKLSPVQIVGLVMVVAGLVTIKVGA
jgi:multidrug transporter EmrE-like cation transporter